MVMQDKRYISFIPIKKQAFFVKSKRPGGQNETNTT